MQKLKLEAFSCQYPDEYRLMNSQELRAFFAGRQNRTGIRCEDKHVIVSVASAKPGLLYLFSSNAAVLKGAEKGLTRTLKDYRRLETFEQTVGGCDACCLRFEYTATSEPIAQYGELWVMKYQKKIFSVFYISGKELNSQNLPVFQEMMNSAAFDAAQE